MSAIQGQYTVSGAPPTPSDKGFGWLQIDAYGNLKVNVVAEGGAAPAALADAVANPTTSQSGVWISAFNGTTWDRVRSGQTAATATLTGYLNALPFAQFNSVSPVVANGSSVVLQCDASGNLKVNVVAEGGSAPAALADAVANPTTSQSGAWLSSFNGTTWDRVRSGQTAATATFTGFLNALPFAQYNSTAPSPSNGQAVSLQADAQGSLQTNLQKAIAGEDLTNNRLRVLSPATSDSTDAWTKYNTSVKVGTAGQVIKASAGKLRQIIAVSANTTTALYLLVHDKSTAPVANDVPGLGGIVIPALTAASIVDAAVIDFGPDGIYASNGISYAISTTPDKVTLPGTSDVMVWARYA